METVVSLDVPFHVRGVAPFGVTLAVLGTGVEPQGSVRAEEEASKGSAATDDGGDDDREPRPIQMQPLPEARAAARVPEGAPQNGGEEPATDRGGEEGSGGAGAETDNAAASNASDEEGPNPHSSSQPPNQAEQDTTALAEEGSRHVEEGQLLTPSSDGVPRTSESEAPDPSTNGSPTPADDAGGVETLSTGGEDPATGSPSLSDDDSGAPAADDASGLPALYFHIVERDGSILSSDRLAEVGADASLAVFYTESALAASHGSDGQSMAPSAPESGDDDAEVFAGETGPDETGMADAGAADEAVREPADPAIADAAPTADKSDHSPAHASSHRQHSPLQRSPRRQRPAEEDDEALALLLVPDELARRRRRYAQPYKWWRDGDEPLYFLAWARGIQVGRPRDGNDRVRWLLERGAAETALLVALTDRAVRAPAREDGATTTQRLPSPISVSSTTSRPSRSRYQATATS